MSDTDLEQSLRTYFQASKAESTDLETTRILAHLARLDESKGSRRPRAVIPAVLAVAATAMLIGAIFAVPSLRGADESPPAASQSTATPATPEDRVRDALIVVDDNWDRITAVPISNLTRPSPRVVSVSFMLAQPGCTSGLHGYALVPERGELQLTLTLGTDGSEACQGDDVSAGPTTVELAVPEEYGDTNVVWSGFEGPLDALRIAEGEEAYAS